MTAHDDRTPATPPRPEPADDEYSATVLASHWIQGPDPDEPGTLRMQDGHPEETLPAVSGPGSGETGTVRVPGPGSQATVPAGDRSAASGEAGTVRVPGPGAGETGTTVRIPARGRQAAVPGVPEGGAAPDGVGGTRPGAPEGGPAPDRVEGTVLRFGPGVMAALAERTPVPVAVVAEPSAHRPRPGLRRHALPALVLLCVLAFLAWQRLGPSVEVRSVAVAARPAVLGCGTTSDIVARVTTDGRPGTLTYRWIRSDGTASGVLRETLARGQREARLHLRWTFEGEGHLTGRADLRLLTPATRTVTAQVTYDCS